MIVGIKQYADCRGISTAAVRKQILADRKLPGVFWTRKTSSGHILDIDTDELAKYMGISKKKLLQDLVVTVA